MDCFALNVTLDFPVCFHKNYNIQYKKLVQKLRKYCNSKSISANKRGPWNKWLVAWRSEKVKSAQAPTMALSSLLLLTKPKRTEKNESQSSSVTLSRPPTMETNEHKSMASGRPCNSTHIFFFLSLLSPLNRWVSFCMFPFQECDFTPEIDTLLIQIWD